MEKELMMLVAEKYPSPEWAFIRQVRNRTGYGKVERYADAIALNLWPSRGMELHGFEAKCSRSDWLSELKNIEKSCAIQKYCDRWWIVVSDESFVQDGELPVTWGLIVMQSETIKVVKEAPKLEPQELSKLFIASILRSISKEDLSQDLVKRLKVGAKKEALKSKNEALKSKNDVRFDRLKERFDSLQKALNDFEKISGISINQYNYEKIGGAVKEVLSHKRSLTFLLERFKKDQEVLKDLLDNKEKAIHQLEELETLKNEKDETIL